MSKQSQLDKAIAALEADRVVLDLAIAKLRAQQRDTKSPPPRDLDPSYVRIVRALPVNGSTIEPRYVQGKKAESQRDSDLDDAGEVNARPQKEA